MAQLHPTPNPFALMMDPDSIFRALESSDRLGRLKSRICRPLDRPLVAKSEDDIAVFDRDVEVDADPGADAAGETEDSSEG